jgi:hypothetical protein
MEGIEHNPVVYDLMSEMAFRSQKVNVEVHIRNMPGSRVLNYGLLLHHCSRQSFQLYGLECQCKFLC